MTRKITAILLAVALVVLMAVPSSAATAEPIADVKAAPYEWSVFSGSEFNLYFRLLPTGKARIINYEAVPDLTVAVSFVSKDEAGNIYSDSDSGSMQAQVTREGAQCFLYYGHAKYKVNGNVIDERKEDIRPGQ